MGLSPNEFWALTVREFWIKHAAFRRAENRQRALVIDLALQTTQFKANARRQLEQQANALRQYPLKKWLL